MAKKQDKELEKSRREYIKIAKQLCYSEECIKNIEKAKNEIQMQNCLVTERTTKR